MRKFRKAISYAIVTAVSTSVMTSGAAAACAQLAGWWNVFLMQSETPKIRTQLYNVGQADNSGAVSVIGFPPTGAPFNNATAVAIKCRLNLSNAGAFTAGPCTSYGVVAGDGGNVNISGQFAVTGCRITGGTITVPGDPAVSILGGYVNPALKNGAGIARQGAGSVFLFNMVKE